MGMRLAYLLLILTAVLVITTGLLAEPTGSLSYPASIVYSSRYESFWNGKWNYYTVTSSVSALNSSSVRLTYTNCSIANGWKISAQLTWLVTSSGSYTSRITMWFNISQPVYFLRVRVATWRNNSNFLVNADIYVNNSLFKRFIPPSSGYNETTLTLYPSGTVQVKLYVYYSAPPTTGYAGNATVIFLGVGDRIQSTSTTAPVSYTAYPDRTDYAVSLSYSNYPIINATVKLPSDFTVTSSTPSYTGRNTTHVWWYNAGTQSITLQATSATKIYPSFTWYPVYSGYRSDGAYFDGRSYIKLSALNGFPSAPSPVSVSLWVRISGFPSSYGYQFFFSYETSTPNPGTAFGIAVRNTDHVLYVATNYNDVAFPVSLQTGVWYHIVVVYSGGTSVTAYVNGTGYSSSLLQTPSFTPQVGYVGAWWGGYVFNGVIRSVQVYNRILSPSDVQQLFTRLDSPPTNGLVLWLAPWSFDPVAGKWYDLSGNGNHATAYGGATCVKLLPNATYILYGSNIILTPLSARFFVKNSSGYFELGVSGDSGLLSKASPGAYQLAAVYTNGTHASMLLSPTVYVVTYELAWRVDSNANTIYVTQMRYRWPTSYGLGYYYPSFTVTVKPQNLTATGSNGYAELPISESQFQPGSVTMYVFDAYSIVDKPVTIPVRNLTIVNFEVYGTNVYDVHLAVNLTYHDGSPFTGRLYFSSNALRCPQYLDFDSTRRSHDVLITPYGGGANYINVSSVYVADSDCIVLKSHVTRYWLKFIVALAFDEIQLRDTYERGDILSGGFYVRNAGNFTLKDLKMRLRFRYEKNGYYYFDRMYNLTFGYYGTELPPQAGSSILLDEANVKLLLLEGNYTLRVTFYSGDTIVLAELVLPFYVGKFYTLAFVCVNQNNQPLAGIKVVAIDINRMKAYSAVTEAEGMAQLKLPSGSYIAYADEHTIETYTTLTLDSDKVLRWTLVTPMAQQTIVVQQPYSITEGITWVVLLAVSGAILYAALKGRQGGGR